MVCINMLYEIGGFTELRLGDIIYLNLLGQSVIVLNTAQATSDLLDKRSAIYSDRPKSTVVSL